MYQYHSHPNNSNSKKALETTVYYWPSSEKADKVKYEQMQWSI